MGQVSARQVGDFIGQALNVQCRAIGELADAVAITDAVADIEIDRTDSERARIVATPAPRIPRSEPCTHHLHSNVGVDGCREQRRWASETGRSRQRGAADTKLTATVATPTMQGFIALGTRDGASGMHTRRDRLDVVEGQVDQGTQRFLFLVAIVQLRAITQLTTFIATPTARFAVVEQHAHVVVTHCELHHDP
jgi:hypothetical protein